MKNYYVYVYLDPRKQGTFDYKWFHFELEPFYVGKGKGKRIEQHLKEYDLKNSGNKYKTRKIKKILREGLKPEVLKYREKLTHPTACRFEKLLIKTIGRKDLKKGPLVNLTDGGEGSYKRILREETKNKISNKAKGRIAWNKGLTKEKDIRVKKYSNKRIGFKYNKESKEQMSISAKKRSNTEKYKVWFEKNNPSYNKEIVRKRSENVIERGTYKNEKNPRWIDVDNEKIIKMYNDGYIIEKIASELNLSYGVIRRRLLKNNVKIFRGKRK